MAVGAFASAGDDSPQLSERASPATHPSAVPCDQFVPPVGSFCIGVAFPQFINFLFFLHSLSVSVDCVNRSGQGVGSSTTDLPLVLEVEFPYFSDPSERTYFLRYFVYFVRTFVTCYLLLRNIFSRTDFSEQCKTVLKSLI